MAKKEGKLLQHLGIVAGICKEIGIAEKIDELVERPKRKVSVGKATEAMIVNALGFTGRALYLTPQFYKSRPTELLLGEGIKAEDLHDDSLGTALEALYEEGITELFYKVASQALKRYGIEHRFVHLDSTTFSLHGAYESEEGTEDQPHVVDITKGYSKDNAPDLNQVVLSMMTTYASSIPVWIEALSGNSNDKVSFRKSIKEYRNQFNEKELPYFVADGALYTKETLKELDGVKWVTRVPETIGKAKEHILAVDREQMSDFGNGYSVKEVKNTYGDVDQRWLLVFSEQAYERENTTLEKNIEKASEENGKKLWHLSNKPFACEADALDAAKTFEKKLRYHTLTYHVERKLHYGKKGRPSANEEPAGESWYIRGELEKDIEAIERKRAFKGMFIIATNESDPEKLSAKQLLEVYKSQGISVERGFRFLKDPMFYAESMYLKSPKRIMALLMVMALSLLVYALAERKLRSALKEQGETIKNQKGKSYNNPTIRWIFQIFENVLLFTFEDERRTENMVMNMDEDHNTIVRCLGPPFEKIYFLD
ncbi:MAG: IS1634 family transposase [Spirochaetales bacterium]|nr:IS1634 family transposase [Spirochaetales bacterium]MCF7938295.1 IS1634 family transposase [Spirochaetales bacterium]